MSKSQKRNIEIHFQEDSQPKKGNIDIKFQNDIDIVFDEQVDIIIEQNILIGSQEPRTPKHESINITISQEKQKQAKTPKAPQKPKLQKQINPSKSQPILTQEASNIIQPKIIDIQVDQENANQQAALQQTNQQTDVSIERDVQNWKNAFKMQVSVNLFKDFNLEKYQADEKYKTLVEEYVNEKDPQQLITGNVAEESANLLIIAPWKAKQLFNFLMEYKQFDVVTNLFKKHQIMQQYVTQLLQRINFQTASPEDYQLLAYVYYFDYTHQLLQDDVVLQILINLLNSQLNQQFNIQLLASITSILVINSNQLFYKFKMFRHQNINYLCVEYFDKFITILSQFLRQSNNYLSNQTIVYFQQLQQFFEQFKEFDSTNSYIPKNLPIIVNNPPSYSPSYIQDSFELFKENSSTLKSAMANETEITFFQRCLNEKCLKIYIDNITKIHPLQFQIQQMIKKIFAKVHHSNCALELVVVKYVQTQELFEQFLNKLSQYQKCMTIFYVKQAFREFLCLDFMQGVKDHEIQQQLIDYNIHALEGNLEFGNVDNMLKRIRSIGLAEVLGVV
ncbi:Conserved_hypothetical protein [Hexamita inflata]|uniref:Uncharacterized protein n=1 Tax=Hexamita inflata TaxID=28002 RepID=A0AA86QBH3_9EUKA|nr:Conserved hypothetical protein [Hexamita inflata]